MTIISTVMVYPCMMNDKVNVATGDSKFIPSHNNTASDINTP